MQGSKEAIIKKDYKIYLQYAHVYIKKNPLSLHLLVRIFSFFNGFIKIFLNIINFLNVVIFNICLQSLLTH